ncbi:hypothetical protein SESBI_32077 [Sesbania bispinosa]|nr:hypothetical protein SESBI_32077 [Sesbania bispinosa]
MKAVNPTYKKALKVSGSSRMRSQKKDGLASLSMVLLVPFMTNKDAHTALGPITPWISSRALASSDYDFHREDP